ncbi:hypothetical protein HID58_065368 [Brassica napus]|uniref:Uncharacterized protein n=1 Tax=Brassica napus TaxID=3708 RepID=A0ABQ7ZCY3_BRANA|nr:hypothetical protein HID58_065368 [Brassica napus]
MRSEMKEELRDKKAQKDYYNMVDFVANAQQRIPKLCPVDQSRRKALMKRIHTTTSGEKILYLQRLQGMQPWVTAIHEEVERLKERYHEQAKLLRECQALKDQVRMLQDEVRMLLMRESELERVL